MADRNPTAEIEQMGGVAVCNMFPDANDYEERDDAEAAIRRIIHAAIAGERIRWERIADEQEKALAYRDACVRKAERERCARVAAAYTPGDMLYGVCESGSCPGEIAAAIRAGDKENANV